MLSIFRFLILGFVLIGFISSSQAAEPTPVPEIGSDFPKIRFPSPKDPKEKAFLGIKGDTFAITEVNAKLVLFEVIGVYCPQCHKQAPLFQRLATRIQSSPETAGKVKMIAYAPGATPMEIAYLKNQIRIPYPLVFEKGYVLHKRLGEPKTPFTLLVSKDGTVQFAHLGVLEDMDELFNRIVDLIQ